jgi:hypothetical protein
MPSSVKLQHIKLTKAQMDLIPDAERTLLVLAAHAANELNALVKIFHFCSQHEVAAGPQQQARNAQAMVLGRILTGKLYECWKLLDSAFFSSKLSKTYEPKFDNESLEALSKIKKYFGNGRNLIKTVRNGHAFHYSHEQVSLAYASIKADEPLDLYLGDEYANTLYAFADTIAGFSMLEGILPGDPAKAFGVMVSETQEVLGLFNQVISACMFTVFKEHIGSDLRALGAVSIEIVGAPATEEVAVPYFIQVPRAEGKPNQTK